MRQFALACLLAACTQAGSGGTAVETARFTPLLCTGGSPGDPACPVNHVDLTMLATTTAMMELVVSPTAAGTLDVSQLAFTASGALHIEHPLFEHWPSGATTPVADAQDQLRSVVLDLPSTEPLPTVHLLGFGSDPISVRFAALRP